MAYSSCLLCFSARQTLRDKFRGWVKCRQAKRSYNGEMWPSSMGNAFLFGHMVAEDTGGLPITGCGRTRRRMDTESVCRRAAAKAPAKEPAKQKNTISPPSSSEFHDHSSSQLSTACVRHLNDCLSRPLLLHWVSVFPHSKRPKFYLHW